MEQRRYGFNKEQGTKGTVGSAATFLSFYLFPVWERRAKAVWLSQLLTFVPGTDADVLWGHRICYVPVLYVAFFTAVQSQLKMCRCSRVIPGKKREIFNMTEEHDDPGDVPRLGWWGSHAEGPGGGLNPPPGACITVLQVSSAASGQASLLMVAAAPPPPPWGQRGSASPSTVASLMRTMCVSANNITKVRFCSAAP